LLLGRHFSEKSFGSFRIRLYGRNRHFDCGVSGFSLLPAFHDRAQQEQRLTTAFGERADQPAIIT